MALPLEESLRTPPVNFCYFKYELLGGCLPFPPVLGSGEGTPPILDSSLGPALQEGH